ncbi:MAG: twin-arginine translocase subunit TatC [Planctomycetaceae bacterium]|nr:twin-arginine translocase subunit TatC [Planctomycetaceae bacterium]
MAPSSKDLFDDSTMSFGEHLEVLRVHLWKALIGVFLGIVIALFQGSAIIGVVRGPIDQALKAYGQTAEDDAQVLQDIDFWERTKSWLWDQSGLDAMSGQDDPGQEDDLEEGVSQPPTNDTIRVAINAGELGNALHQVDPEAYPVPSEEARNTSIELPLSAPEFRQFKIVADRANNVVALNVQEPFLTYLKVSMISGLVLASPWVFYQMWLFVAAGLFPHERKYVYLYGTMSMVLFVVGVVFCFYLVFPFVLGFLLGFNEMLHIQPQIRLSEWISFAVTLPLLFGVSFQLPLVMLFMERLSIFEADDYREKRRMSILVIAIISMLLTPADPISMLLMMFPLCLLYELGIWLCQMSPPKSPFETATA